MKRKHITLRTGSLILVVLLCFIFTTTPAFAAKLNTKNKIDPVLAEVMSEFSNTDLVPLSIWFYDIDESVLADNTLDEVDMLVSDKKLPYYSIDTIDQDTAKIDVSNTDLSVEQIQLISVAKRDSSKVIYTHHNELILNDIVNDLERYNIIYCCSYAPNIVLEIQKSEIHKLEENVNVSDIYYYDEEALDTDLSNSKTTPSDIDLEDCCEFIELYDSLTGQGINVGMIESGWINQKALPIKNVTDHLFQNKSNSTGGTNYTTGHETGVASMLIGDCTEAGYDFKGMIPDSTLYHTSTKVNGGWKAGVEWLIENGAFKIANSSGTDFMNEGFVWVMYDALNKISNADLDDEIVHYPFMDNYTYYVIEVE